MKKKQFRLIVKMALVVIFMGGMLLSHFFVIGSVFAQNQKQQVKVIGIDTLDQKINTIEKKINAIEQKISKYEPEICAIEKLIEISESNLIAPKYVTGILIGLIVAFGTLITVIIFILKNSIIKQIEEKGKGYTEEINKLMASVKELHKEDRHLFAYNYNMAAVTEWNRKKFDQAIDFAQKAIENAEETWGKEPEEPYNVIHLNRFRSNLAYFYVEKGKDDKRGEAIEYAKLGLKSGEDSHDLDLIDNFLYIMMKFSLLPEDNKLWLRVYNTYKDEIYNESIRTDKEMKDFKDHYDKLINQPL